jgi:tetratricopeptide (TPR) repeat protein
MDRSCVRAVRRAPWGAVLVVGALMSGSTAGLNASRNACTPMSPCERAVRFGDPQHAVESCLASYQRAGNEHNLVWAAKAYLRLGKIDEANGLAQRLLAGPRLGDAHAILSYVALRRGLVTEARMHARLAHTAHEATGDVAGMASDAVSLSQAAWKAGDLAAALAAADEALSLAPHLDDSRLEVRAYLARADVLRRMGDARSAVEALKPAIDRATEPCDKAWVRLRSANYLIDVRQDGLAMVELTAAEEANRRCGSPDVSSQIAMNSAWLLRGKDPASAIAKLDEIKQLEEESADALLLRGYLAADRDDLAAAERYFVQAANMDPPDGDWPWQIMCTRAQLAELRAGLFGEVLAEFYYRHSMAMVAALRATARARSAHFVSSHRAPYEGLIGLLARQGRWRAVLSVVLELDATDMLRATADELTFRSHAAEEVDTPVADIVTNPELNVEDILSAWQSRDLVIVIAPSPRELRAGRERAYRLRVFRGDVTGEDVGDASVARRSAEELFADPADQRAARALGRIIVPPRSDGSTLHVLAIGALSKVPLAALRDDDGSLSIAKRPVVRVLGLRANGRESSGAGAPVVIADSRGNLMSAMVEGVVVASALGPDVQVSGSGTATPATRAQLWAARDAALLHLAGHVVATGRWRALQLADGDVDPAEMVKRGLAPRIAVLAGCGSAAATDEEGWGSIAAALLQSGTALVIATDRSIADDAALSLMQRFYREADWRTDPARALARVQRVLAEQSATSSDAVTKAGLWAAFSALARPPGGETVHRSQ